MLHLTLIMCDTLLIATCEGKGTSCDRYLWDVKLQDVLSGKRFQSRWTQEQLTAILALGLGGVGEDKTPGYHVEQLYATALPALEGCPQECWPIP